MPRTSKTEQTEALARLREWVKPGDTVFTILRHVSRSGMRRVIDLKVIRTGQDGKPEVLCIGYTAAEVLGRTYDRKREGIVVNGAGMDMGFEVVYSLSRFLFEPRPQGESFESNNLVQRWL